MPVVRRMQLGPRMRIEAIRGSHGWSVALLAVAMACGDGDGAVVPDGAVDAAMDAAPPDAVAPDAAPDAAPATPVIVSPPDGAELRARRQVFVWTDAGYDYRLRIGTSPGGADLYESPPLGDATTVTVDGLPLSGATIYAQLLSGPADAPTMSTNTYTAPVRRGLCVVVDFADRHLEDWDGPGMRSLDDVTAQLGAMEAHWEWLSRGLEAMTWDVIRIELAHTLTDDAFPGWPEFREEVARLALDTVDLADYDVDSDGVLDAIFAVVASGGTSPPYAIGGASQTGGANMFVDGQDSLSVIVGATGNFNHELAHSEQVPDLYGDYGTIGDLSLMASSWPLPPNDFSALERVRLGWVEPVVVDATTRDVVVPSANDHLFALRIPTQRPEEYFLLEYRKRPAAGYGSAAFDHDGLAVYHVLEGSHANVDPPFMKLEPADGITAADYQPAPDDLASPDNPGQLDPWVVRSYFGDDPVFQLENVRRRPGAIVVDVVMHPPGTSSAVELIANSSVETGPGGWGTGGFLPDEATFTWASIGANGSSHSLQITSPAENDVQWVTRVTDVAPGRGHQLCGYLRGEDVTGGRGATLSLAGTFEHTDGLYGTFDWTRRCVVIGSPSGVLDAACRLGGFGATTSGTMWCDDVSLIRLESAFGTPP